MTAKSPTAAKYEMPISGRSHLSRQHTSWITAGMGMDANCMKLRTLFLAFDLLTTNVADVCGVSRPYVARIISETDPFCGSQTFWATLERNLGTVIEQRRGKVFKVEAQPLEQVESLTKPPSTLKPAA